MKITGFNVGVILNVFRAPTASLRRDFSTGATAWRRYDKVTIRKIRKDPEYQAGDVAPRYIPKERKEYPVYPYGDSLVYKQSNRGLYGARFVGVRNQVSESKRRTKRKQKPNVQKAQFWSDVLKKTIKIKAVTGVMRTVAKEGGIDNYLVKDTKARLKELGPAGWKLRFEVLMKKEQEKNRPHQNIAYEKNAEGEEVPVYFKFSKGDTKLKVVVGRRKLQKLLFPYAQKEAEDNSLSLSYKKFIDQTRGVPTETLIEQLVENNVDKSLYAL